MEESIGEPMECMDNVNCEHDGRDDVENGEMTSVVYHKGITNENFGQWLYNYLPSNVEKSSGIAWVAVNNDPCFENPYQPDLLALRQEWEHIKASSSQVYYKTIKHLALNHNYRSGKWMIFSESGGKVDHLWTTIATGIMEGHIPSKCAKVSTFDHNWMEHVICVYTEDFTNMDSIMVCEQAIRKVGIKCVMFYKPDIYTYLGIYSRNGWNLTPNILYSNFDILKGTSLVELSEGITDL